MLLNGEEWRPDVCGVMVQLEPEGSEVAIELYEVWRDSFKSEHFPRLLSKLKQSYRLYKLPLVQLPFRLFPFGADLPIQYPVDAAFLPYQPRRNDFQVMQRPQTTDVGEYVGPMRDFLYPSKT
jgi:hypothetical protein